MQQPLPWSITKSLIHLAVYCLLVGGHSAQCSERSQLPPPASVWRPGLSCNLHTQVRNKTLPYGEPVDEQCGISLISQPNFIFCPTSERPGPTDYIPEGPIKCFPRRKCARTSCDAPSLWGLGGGWLGHFIADSERLVQEFVQLSFANSNSCVHPRRIFVQTSALNGAGENVPADTPADNRNAAPTKGFFAQS